MLDKQKRIDEDGIAFAVNERDRIGNPSEIFFARRKALGRTIAFLGQQFPVQFRHILSLLDG
jgi:hypothetical protein